MALEYEDEIIDALMAHNLAKTVQLSEEWYKQIPLEKYDPREKKRAEESFLLCRIFFNKQERLYQIQNDKERAVFALKILQNLEEVRTSNLYGQFGDSRISQAIAYVLHGFVADGFAKTLSGQKSYNLDQEDIVQLTKSLIVIHNWKLANETLNFLLNINPRSAIAHLLKSYIAFQIREEKDFFLHLREALFIAPEILESHWQYLPLGFFENYWLPFSTQDEAQYIKLRRFALKLELDGVYQYKRVLQGKELDQNENDFRQKYREYIANSAKSQDAKPRLMQLLCWLCFSYATIQDYEKLEEFRSYFLELDHEAWQIFQSKNIQKK